MGLYCGIDLHSNNHVLTVIDQVDRRVYERRLPNDLAITKAALEPYRAELVAVAVESTFNWYWLVDGRPSGLGLCPRGARWLVASPRGAPSLVAVRRSWAQRQ
jgi:hypothetical protein